MQGIYYNVVKLYTKIEKARGHIMSNGYTQVFCGHGDGKSSAAIGKGLVGACLGKKVIIVQFLKGKIGNEIQLFAKLEPEVKLFRFEKSDESFDSLSEGDQAEEIKNIKNGINFAKKVLATKECDILILDEVVGLADEGIITVEEITSVINSKSSDAILIMSGQNMPEELEEHVDYISTIESKK